ncbi:hypothetical protein C8Q80DRAFT_1123673 [Daedaleopsis nitida]|nr:hypothetical protein C8Q80DRAFT_1123673 [Daedaleopsis nitida]
MVHLGRPLFGSRFDAGNDTVMKAIFDFAAEKLLLSFTNAIDYQALVCLSVRIPIDFKRLSTGPLERKLVSDHMRLLLYANPGFTSMITVSSSEPTLAHASYRYTSVKRWRNGQLREESIKWSPIRALSENLESGDLDLGTRGEIAAAALLLDARDRAVTMNGTRSADQAPRVQHPPDDDDQNENAANEPDWHHDGDSRIVPVALFLEALLGTEGTDNLKCCEESILRSFSVVNQEYLRLALARGAAIICADNHSGIDILIPVLFDDLLLTAKVSAIMIQVKNSRHYTTVIDPVLFTCMDPYKCGLFDKHVQTPPPVLRVILALGATESAVVLREVPRRRSPKPRYSKFTAYDIWCAGAFRKTFAVISPEEEGFYATVLRHIRDAWDVELHLEHADLKTALHQMQPMVLADEDCYSLWAELQESDNIGKDYPIELQGGEGHDEEEDEDTVGA